MSAVEVASQPIITSAASNVAVTTTAAAAAATPSDDKKTSLSTYIVVGVICLAVVLLLWYAYQCFTTNASEEDCMSNKKKNKDKDRDETIANYNLQDAVYQLENIQADVLKNLSDLPNI
jgi:hypothetical protein